MRNIKIKYILNGKTIEDTLHESVSIDKYHEYSFMKAQQSVSEHLSVKHGWDCTRITFLSIEREPPFIMLSDERRRELWKQYVKDKNVIFAPYMGAHEDAYKTWCKDILREEDETGSNTTSN